jgi:hypothetical protein
MNTSASMGPVQFTGLTYLICAVISLGVAGIIKLIIGIIQMRNKGASAKTTATDSSKKTDPARRSKG